MNLSSYLTVADIGEKPRAPPLAKHCKKLKKLNLIKKIELNNLSEGFGHYNDVGPIAVFYL